MLRKISLIIFILVLSGCNAVPVAEDLNQVQANEIVAVLNQQGIVARARKATGGRTRYSVEVKRTSYSEAVGILNERNLPGEARVSFSELISQRGIMPASRDVEYLRLDKALALEVEDALLLNPDISGARVVVRLNFLRDAVQPSASIMVKKKEGADLSEDDLKRLAISSLPGIKEEDVFVSIFTATTAEEDRFAFEGVSRQDGTLIRVPLVSFLYFWKVPEDESYSLALAFLLFFFLVALIAGLGGYWAAYSRKFAHPPDTMFSGVRSFADSRPSQVFLGGKDSDKGKRELPDID